MNWAAWVLLAWFGLNVLVAAFGAARPVKAREARDTGSAIGYVTVILAIESGLAVLLLVAVGVIE